MTDAQDTKSQDQFRIRLQECIDSAGSVYAFAKKVGKPANTIRRYLTNSEPSRPMLVALAAAAGVSVEWLAVGTGARAPTENATPDLSNTHEFTGRFRTLVGKAGGTAQFCGRTGIDPKIVDDLCSGHEVSLPTLRSLSCNPHIPIRWLLSGTEQNREQAHFDANSMREFWSRVQAVDDQRIYSGEIAASDIRFADEHYEWKQPVYELMLRIYERLSPGFYALIEVSDNNYSPEIRRGDLAVIDTGPKAAGPGYHAFTPKVDAFGLHPPSFIGRLSWIGSELCLENKGGDLSARPTPLQSVNAERMGEIVLLIRRNLGQPGPR